MIHTQSEVSSTATTALTSKHARVPQTQCEDEILKLYRPTLAHLRLFTYQLHHEASLPVPIRTIIASNVIPAQERLIQILSGVSVRNGGLDPDNTHCNLGHGCALVKSVRYIYRRAEISLPENHPAYRDLHLEIQCRRG